MFFGPLWLRDVSSHDSIFPVISKVDGRFGSTYHTWYSGLALMVIHVSARLCRILGSVQDFLTQLSVRSCGIVVITVKVLAKS